MARTTALRRGADLYSGDNHHATPDILTLIAMALPDVPAVTSCIWIAWLMERPASPETLRFFMTGVSGLICWRRFFVWITTCLLIRIRPPGEVDGLNFAARESTPLRTQKPGRER